MLLNNSLLSVFASIMLMIAGMGGDHDHCANAAAIIRKTKSDAVKKKSKNEATTTVAATTTSGPTCPSECVITGATTICEPNNSVGRLFQVSSNGDSQMIIRIDQSRLQLFTCLILGGEESEAFPVALASACFDANIANAATGVTYTTTANSVGQCLES